MSCYEIHETNIEYPYIVFLHGWGQNKAMLNPLVNCVALYANTINFDLPGFGESILPHPYTINDYILYIRKILKNEKIRPLVIVGHSFGGKIAAFYALKYPTNLLLLAPSIVKPRYKMSTAFKIRMYKLYNSLKNKNIIKKIPNYFLGSNDYQNATGNLRETFKNVVHAYLDKDIKKLKKKTIIFCGKNDKVIDKYQAKKMKKHLVNGELITINGDHFAYLKCRHEISQTIKEAFFKKI